MSKEARGSHGSSKGVVGRGTRVRGRIHGNGDLLVEGRCDGEVTLSGHLHVAAGGTVDAPVDVGDLTVEGGVLGDVAARGTVILRSTGAIRGAIRADRFSLEDGARFTGHIEMDVELPTGLAPKGQSGRGR